MSDTGFYSALAAHEIPLSTLLRDEYFHTPPSDWHVVLADIRNSTQAVQRGAHNDVNLIAAGALIAGLNVARHHNIEVPFFFGGDGGTLIVPGEFLADVCSALHRHANNAERNFNLAMYVGSVSVQEIVDSGHYLRLAKTRLGNGFCKALLVGDGLKWAERQIKSMYTESQNDSVEEPPPDMSGLQCRWDKIAPPKERQNVVCYLIEAVDPARQLEIYSAVLLEADRFFGSPELRTPVSIDRLKLVLSMKRMRREMLAQFGKWSWAYFLREGFRTLAAKLFHGKDVNLKGYNSAAYLREIISNADTFTLDGRINTIISGKSGQTSNFLTYLDRCEQEGLLRYGHHENRESIMTCYIQSFEKNHIHFVDGADGGYTAAATELKKKLAARV